MPSPISPAPTLPLRELPNYVASIPDTPEAIDHYEGPAFSPRQTEAKIETLQEARLVIGGLTEKQISQINLNLNSKRFLTLFKNKLESELASSKKFLKTLRSQKKPSKRIPTIFAKAELEKRHKRRGDTALISAIKVGLTDIADVLIKKMTSEQIGISDHSGATALVWAAYRQYPQMAQLLIKQMTIEQINSTTIDGVPFLIWAIEHQHTALVHDLIAKKVNLHLKDASGNTALISACKYGLVSCVRSLLKQSDISIANKHGDTGLMWAVTNRQLEIVNLLLEKMTPEQIGFTNNNGIDALLLATILDKLITESIQKKQGYEWHLFLKVNHSKMTLPKNEQVKAISETDHHLIYSDNNTLKKYILEHSAYLSIRKKQQLSRVLTNVETEAQINAVPKDPQKRQKMYASMRRNLEHVAIKLSAPGIAQETKETALNFIVESHNLCMTPQFQAASFARKLLSTGEVAAEQDMLPESHIDKILHQLRTDIFNALFNEELKKDYNIHNFNGMIAAVGEKVGVTDPDSAYDFDPLDSSLKEKLLTQFYNRYSPAQIIHTIRQAIHREIIAPAIVSELFADYVFRNLKNDEHEMLESQIYQNAEDYDYTLTDAAVPYLLTSMGILDPKKPPEQFKLKAPFFVKQIAHQKKSELIKKQMELRDLLKSLDTPHLDSSNLPAAIDALNREIDQLEKWSIWPSVPIPKPINPTCELNDEDIRLAGEEVKGMGLPINIDDLNFIKAVEKLMVSGRWTRTQATELIQRIFLDA